MVTEADHQQWAAHDLQPYLEHVLSVFGIERVLFGGDYPVVELASSYPRWIETALAATVALPEADKRRLFYENAQKFYRL
jgi:L-fuconolactonase